MSCSIRLGGKENTARRKTFFSSQPSHMKPVHLRGKRARVCIIFFLFLFLTAPREKIKMRSILFSSFSCCRSCVYEGKLHYNVCLGDRAFLGLARRILSPNRINYCWNFFFFLSEIKQVLGRVGKKCSIDKGEKAWKFWDLGKEFDKTVQKKGRKLKFLIQDNFR